MARHLKEVAEGVAKLAGSIPNRADLVGSQRALPLALRARHFDQSDGARLNDPAMERPVEQLAHRSEGPVCRDGFTLVNDRVQQLDYVAPRDSSNVPALPARENMYCEIPTRLVDVSRRPFLPGHVSHQEFFHDSLDPVGTAACSQLLALLYRVSALANRLVEVRGTLARLLNSERPVQAYCYPAMLSRRLGAEPEKVHPFTRRKDANPETGNPPVPEDDLASRRGPRLLDQ